jgi:predicted nuclease of predicted toxin-antitoxin system
VKLLLDENLSRKLVTRLADLFPESIHVSHVDLLEASDGAVWDYAKANGFVIVTADADFFELAITLGPPPKVIWLRRWTHPTRDAENVLRREAVRIAEFGVATESGVLILDKAKRSGS